MDLFSAVTDALSVSQINTEHFRNLKNLFFESLKDFKFGQESIMHYPDSTLSLNLDPQHRQPVLWIPIRIGSVFMNFVDPDPDPYSQF